MNAALPPGRLPTACGPSLPRTEQKAFKYESLLLLLAPISPFYFVTNVTKTQFVIVISVVVCARNICLRIVFKSERGGSWDTIKAAVGDSLASSPSLFPAAEPDPVMRPGSIGPLLLMSSIKYASFVCRSA